MFTVKHTSDDFCEAIYSATDVRYEPARDTPLNQVSDPTPQTVWLYGGDSGNRPITGGTIYVMNDAGSTVAKYLLSPQAPT